MLYYSIALSGCRGPSSARILPERTVPARRALDLQRRLLREQSAPPCLPRDDLRVPAHFQRTTHALPASYKLVSAYGIKPEVAVLSRNGHTPGYTYLQIIVQLARGPFCYEWRPLVVQDAMHNGQAWQSDAQLRSFATVGRVQACLNITSESALLNSRTLHVTLRPNDITSYDFIASSPLRPTSLFDRPSLALTPASTLTPPFAPAQSTAHRARTSEFRLHFTS